MTDSIHTARWINQIASMEWDLHIFPCMDAEINHELRNIYVHDGIFREQEVGPGVVQVGSIQIPFLHLGKFSNQAAKIIRKFRRFEKFIKSRESRLASLIQKIKPDLIHSLEFQHSAYITLEAKALIKNRFPPWMVTNWGSDIFLFGRLPEHAAKIRHVMANCDYYSCECQRDVVLAQSFGFNGEIMPILPNAGGFDLDLIQNLRSPVPTSERRLILLKGYQTWAGRALVGLRALELCSDCLRGYKVAIYLANEDVILKARLFSEKTGIPVEFIQKCSHEEMLRYHGQARISIGLSISDAISTSFLEAIVMGSFPIQSCTGCSDEWIQDGASGLIVPPEDPQVIASAISTALTNDNLVNRAAELNRVTTKERLDSKIIKPQVIKMYEIILKKNLR
jgi:hypothetical protein